MVATVGASLRRPEKLSTLNRLASAMEWRVGNMRDLDHIETFTPRDDPAGDLSRLIKIILDEKGPFPFGPLLLEVRASLSIEPYALHDHLNSMIVCGLVKLAPTGFYLLA